MRYESIQIDMPIDVMRGIVASKGHVSFIFLLVSVAVILLFFIVADGAREIDCAQERRPFLVK